jgi:hypothetical protein
LDPQAVSAQKPDYLSSDEIEQLREAQEPPQRIKLLVELLEKRLEKARALKDPAATKPGPEDPKAAKGSKNPRQKQETSEVESAKATSSPSKGFAEWMDEYLQCLEEVSSNVENFSSVPMDPKAYLKALNKLDESLKESTQWIGQIDASLERSERGVVEEVAEVLEELSDDVKAAIEKAQEQIILLKEAQKARSSRHR